MRFPHRGEQAPNPPSQPPQGPGGPGTVSPGLRWGPLAITLFWLAIMAGLYLAMNHYLQPRALVVTAAGELIIPRARDGHFYAPGTINGQPVRFLVDTGASMVVINEKLAQKAALAAGTPTIFRTANGELRGRTVPGVPVSVGPLALSGTLVGVGLSGGDDDLALLGQTFLSKFELLLSGDEMVLRKKGGTG